MWVPKVGPGRYRVGSGQESEGSPDWGTGEEVSGKSNHPIHQSLSEEIRRVLGSVNITTHFRPPGTLRQVLFHPKDMVPKGKKTNVIYQAECGQCGEKYVGETQQPLPKRVHQHTHTTAGRLNSAVLDHMCATGHVLDLDSFKILEREADWRRRGI